MYQDIKERTFNFSLQIINLSVSLPNTKAGVVLGKQMLRSGTSIGANIEEAVAAYSKDDFIFKTNIALREAWETHYWLRLIEQSSLMKSVRLTDMLNEIDEIKKILGSIVSKLRNKSKFKN